MSLNRKEVFNTDTFEEQRLKINEIGKDLFDISRGDESFEALKIDGNIIDGTNSTGTSGQFLKCTGTGVLWKTLSISNVLWVTKDGVDTNDGLSWETAKASIGSALLAANSGYLGKLQDASNQILINKKLIQEETIGWLLTEFDSFTFPNSPPESGRYKDSRNLIYRNIDEICDRALAQIAVEYDEALWGTDWTFPGASLTDDSQRFKDAYRLIQKNKEYIVEEAFNTIAINFPGFTNPDPEKCRRDIGYYIDAVSLDIYLGTNKYSRKFASLYYSGTDLIYLDGEVTESIATFAEARDLMIQATKNLLPYNDPTITVDTDLNGVCINVENAINSLHNLIADVLQNGIGQLSLYPETEPTFLTNEDVCRRDINFIVRSVANDLYDGGNTNTIKAAKKYFDIDENFIFINNESLQSIVAFTKAGELMKMAVTNQLYEKNLNLLEGPEEYGGTGPVIEYGPSGNANTCIDVQLAIDNLITIVTTVISDGDLSLLSTITETKGLWANFENICIRDIGYIIDAIASDLKNGGNVNCVDAGNSYYEGTNLVFVNNELTETIAAFEKAKELMILAMQNWQITQQGDTYKPLYSFIEPYIDNTIVVETDILGDPNYPTCVDVQSAIENYFNIIEHILENGVSSVEQQLPSFKTTIFVKSGVYTEQNPIILPPNTGIVGDNLREVTILPANSSDDVFYLNNGSYITGATFSGHLFPSVVGSFPKVQVGETVTISCSGTEERYVLTVPITACNFLSKNMTVSGPGIGTGAIITDMFENKVFLSVANEETFTNQNIVFNNYIGTTGVITKSPYIQNCTSITTTGAGLRVDGNLAGGTASFVLDSYTQYNQGGDGIIIVNEGYTQLVSIFEICCNRAVYLSGGSLCSITNSNTDFGNFGLIADGISPLKYIAKIDGSQQRGNIFVAKNLRTNPYVNQVVTFGNNGNPYYFISAINITNEGDGYTPSNPPLVIIDSPTGPDGIDAQAVANIQNGKIVSITLISSGSQFIDAPNVTIVGGDPIIQAEAIAKVYPQYYSIISATNIIDGRSTITFDETIPFNLADDTDIYFYQVTKIIANSHCFEFVGSGTQINKAIPSKGGVPIQENEIVELNGGKVAFTSTDHLGNFRIGQGIQINQNTGTLAGDSFERSLFVTVTPFILALS
jgi:hypothetical protein